MVKAAMKEMGGRSRTEKVGRLQSTNEKLRKKVNNRRNNLDTIKQQIRDMKQSRTINNKDKAPSQKNLNGGDLRKKAEQNTKLI